MLEIRSTSAPEGRSYQQTKMVAVLCTVAAGVLLARAMVAPRHESHLLWHLSTDKLPPGSSLAVDEHDHILVTSSTDISRLSPRGERLWRRHIVQNGQDFAVSPSTGLHGTTFVPGRTELAAINAAGSVLWRTPSIDGSAFTGSPSLSLNGSTVIVGCGWDTDCEAITAFDTRTGRQLWRFAPHGTYTPNQHTFWAKPTIAADGTVLVCDYGGYLVRHLPNQSGLRSRPRTPHPLVPRPPCTALSRPSQLLQLRGPRLWIAVCGGWSNGRRAMALC